MNIAVRTWFFIALTGAMLFFSGCSRIQPRNPAPISQDQQTIVPGIPEARFWGDAIPPDIERRINTLSNEQIKNDFPALYGRPHNYLAISGGGSNGAFGAGLLTGWTKSGDRPEFQMVTGVSTGALIAPWAFLGPSYDHVIKQVYTTTTTDDILDMRNILVILFSDAAAESLPLLNMIQRYVTDDVIKAIAAEHRKGRRLYIGTTDIDQMRPRIWDIGAIAVSGRPGAKKLIQKLMLASASIPGAFPPVRIKVASGGKIYDELHVDGGASAQVFVYPAALNWQKLLQKVRAQGPARIFVIRNAPLKPESVQVRPRILSIASRSISSLIRTQGLGDIYLIYMLSKRDKSDFNLAFIPDDFDEKSNEAFDKVYMNKLFDFGFKLGKDGYRWDKTPPGWVE